MCMTYSFLSRKLTKVFQSSQFSLIQVKMVNHFEGHVIFQDTEHLFEENILDHYLHCSFL